MASVKAILDMDLSDLEQLSRADLAREVSKVASAANKRLARLEKAGVVSPAATYAIQHGGKFSVAGKDVGELITELNRARGFMEAKTGNLKGARETRKNTLKTIADATKTEYENIKSVFDKMTLEEERDFWRAVDRLNDSTDGQALGRSEVIEIVTESYTKLNENERQQIRRGAEEMGLTGNALDTEISNQFTDQLFITAQKILDENKVEEPASFGW